MIDMSGVELSSSESTTSTTSSTTSTNLTAEFPTRCIEINKLSIEQINEIRSNLHPILSDEEERGLELANMFVVEVKPNDANRLIGELNKLLNKSENDNIVIQQYSHLKKMRKVHIDTEPTLSTTDTTTTSDSQTQTIPPKNNKTRNFILELLIAPEENYPNLQQFYQQCINEQQQQQQQQPTFSIINNNNNNSNNNNNNIYKDLTEYQKRVIQLLIDNKLCLKTIKVPKYPPLTQQLWVEWNKLWPMTFKVHPFSTPLVETLEDKEIMEMHTYMKLAIEQANIGKRLGFNPVGAVLVDPVSNTIQGAGFDQTPVSSALASGDASLSSRSDQVKYHLPPILAHCTMNVIHQLANQHIERSVQKNGGQTLTLSSMQKTANSEDEAYLATDLHLYITREPCIMCSMALVHSRIKRVIFGSAQPNAGGLGGYLKVHTQKSINHRFQVYCGILQPQCQQLFN